MNITAFKEELEKVTERKVVEETTFKASKNPIGFNMLNTLIANTALTELFSKEICYNEEKGAYLNIVQSQDFGNYYLLYSEEDEDDFNCYIGITD